MKHFLKETGIVIAFILICVLIKSASISMYKKHYAIPVITNEMQERFNNEIAYPSYGNAEFSFGLKGLEYLDYPNYKFDHKISRMSQLENINDTRSQILDEHAKEYGRKVAIWCLFVLLGLRYGRKIFSWLAH